MTLPKWYDLHAHLRQGDFLKPMIEQHLKMGCAGVLAMPNTKPPVAKVFKNDPATGWSVEEYIEMLNAAGGDTFQRIIVPLYLTATTTAKMIEDGAKKGVLKACKYYPPHGTTNAEHGASLSRFMENGVLAAMEDNGVVFCVHGEDHGMLPEEYYDSAMNAEISFYQKSMGAVVKEFPSLRIVAEHITTKAAVDFVLDNGPKIGATVTPQHLLYTVGHMMQGLKYHLYCMPIVKFDKDREALREAVISFDNTKFFAGTDSAPHTIKATACGCAAGCYTGGIAPQLYAEAFEQAGADMKSAETQEAFKNFLCLNGPTFYGLPAPKETFTLSKKPQSISIVQTPDGPITPLPIGMLPTPTTEATLNWSVEL
jgi:dihydroorotase